MEQKVKQLVDELNEVLECHANSDDSDVIDAASVILINIALKYNDPIGLMKLIATHLLENTFMNVTGIAKIIKMHVS